MAARKIACLGAGSQYFTRALGDLAVTTGLAGSELALYDIDCEKADVMARHGRRLAEQSGTGLRVGLCAELAEALDGADFVITSIGGGGQSRGSIYGTGVHVQDVLIPERYGIRQVIGDTGGPAGMMMALRSIPIYLNICHEMEKRSPTAILLNHSNPMAVLCRAMVKYSRINVIGICHGVQLGIVGVARLLGVPPEELETVWIGTNHYHWFTRIRHQGRDVYPELWRRLAEGGPTRGEEMTHRLSAAYGFRIVYPPDDHAVEFYPYLTQLPASAPLPYGLHASTTAEGAEAAAKPEAVVGLAQRGANRTEELEAYAAQLAKVQLPERQSDPITGEGLGMLIEDIAIGRRRVHIVNVPNRGAVPNLPDHALLEIEGVSDSAGVRGIYVGEAPTSLMGLLQKRIAWQELVADAGVRGDRRLALQAVLLDELTVRPELAEAMLDELLAASRELLPQFG